MIDGVRRQMPAVTVIRPDLERAAGALLLAFDAAGIPAGDGVEDRLRATVPPPSLFDTRAWPSPFDLS